MQLLVYIFIFLIGLAIAASAYLGLTFTPIEAVLSGMLGSTLATVIFERTLRHRAEGRLEKGIEDLSRLLSTDAQAGQVLSHRVNKMADMNAGPRLETVEADVSVLGTVVRQVAEAVAHLEEVQAEGGTPDTFSGDAKPETQYVLEPIIALGDVKKALDDGRIDIIAQPIIKLPQRQLRAHDVVPQLQAENGETIRSADFIPRKGGNAIIRQIDQLGFEHAFELAMNNEKEETQLLVHVPLSKASLGDNSIIEWIIARLDTSRTIATHISFSIMDRDWKELGKIETLNLEALVEKGASISIVDVSSLRMDFAELAKTGVSSVRADSTIFINEPEKYTDYHGSDVAPYISRFGIDLIISDVQSEQQILSLLEDGISLIEGQHVAPVEQGLSLMEMLEETTKAAG